MVPILGYLIAIPFSSWKLWGKKDQGDLFNYSCPPIDLEVLTTSALKLTMGNTIDVVVHTPTNAVKKFPKKVRLRQQCGAQI